MTVKKFSEPLEILILVALGFSGGWLIGLVFHPEMPYSSWLHLLAALVFTACLWYLMRTQN